MVAWSTAVVLLPIALDASPRTSVNAPFTRSAYARQRIEQTAQRGAAIYVEAADGRSADDRYLAAWVVESLRVRGRVVGATKPRATVVATVGSNVSAPANFMGGLTATYVGVLEIRGVTGEVPIRFDFEVATFAFVPNVVRSRALKELGDRMAAQVATSIDQG